MAVERLRLLTLIIVNTGVSDGMQARESVVGLLKVGSTIRFASGDKTILLQHLTSKFEVGSIITFEGHALDSI